MFEKMVCFLRNKLIFQWLSIQVGYLVNPIFFKYKYWAGKVKKIDTFTNYEYYKKYIYLLQNQIEKGHPIAKTGYYSMSDFYGHNDNILKYAQTKKWLVPYLGEVEHGVRFMPSKLCYEKNIMAYTVQGMERIEEITDNHEDIPIFCIGPYIKYVSSFYDDKTYSKLKAQLGKTLLIIPSHSFELEEYRIRGNSFLNWVIDNYGDKYDSIVVCVYWNDCIDDDINQYVEKGCRLFTAGLRFDNSFLRRLKSMIELSDLVIGNDMGTNIGYVLALGKKYILYPNDISTTLYNPVYVKEFEEAFYTSDGVFSQMQLDKQKKLYNRFWGGNIEITPMEFNEIFTIIKKIMRKSSYDIKKFKMTMRKIYDGDASIINDYEREVLMKIFVSI